MPPVPSLPGLAEPPHHGYAAGRPQQTRQHACADATSSVRLLTHKAPPGGAYNSSAASLSPVKHYTWRQGHAAKQHSGCQEPLVLPAVRQQARAATSLPTTSTQQQRQQPGRVGQPRQQHKKQQDCMQLHKAAAASSAPKQAAAVLGIHTAAMPGPAAPLDASTAYKGSEHLTMIQVGSSLHV